MKETWKFIALLAVGLGVILAYAFVPEHAAEGLFLRQASLAAICEEPSAAAAKALDSVKQEKETVDTAKQRILLFGDSMTQPLALRLADWANKNGHELTCVTWCSSSTHLWAEGDTIGHYMRKVRPTHVFICLGSNELYTNNETGTVKNIKTILEKVGNVPTVWIGPPNWCEDKGYNKWLLNVMGPKRYYPSYKLTFQRLKDGRHPNQESSSMWMDKVIEWMNAGHSVHPFVMKKPDKKDRRYRQYLLPLPGSKKGVAEHGNAESHGEEIPSAEQSAEQPSTAEQPSASEKSTEKKEKASDHQKASAEKKEKADKQEKKDKPEKKEKKETAAKTE